jgi:type IV pilus assembly protein PilA
MRRSSRVDGFTLIELVVVVGIIGLLAVIAVPNFLRFQLKSKTSEGKTNLAAIRTAEESYYSEFGAYVSAAASPPGISMNAKTVFSNASGAGAGFDRLGWSPDGPIYFNYAVSTAGASPPDSEYWAAAAADIDADAAFQAWGVRNGGSVTAPADLGLVCPAIVGNQVGPCDPSHGQSVF